MKTQNLCFEKYLPVTLLGVIMSLTCKVRKHDRGMYDVKDSFKIKMGLICFELPFVLEREAETLEYILRCDCVPFVKHKKINH